MHSEWAALLKDLAGTVGDLHQKIDDLNDQISQKQYSPIDGEKTDAPSNRSLC